MTKAGRGCQCQNRKRLAELRPPTQAIEQPGRFDRIIHAARFVCRPSIDFLDLTWYFVLT